ncbi:MAG TPA: bifunctional diaminohydroxyphosphoribosylaminopyrimidine deaminase/5-amino-6-(5-phosphoribosylamino)uracil reductase RibD [Fimbriimonas sp.]|nr:bifunctional diaminohydroxyphosphoribosylaminopyrimidine deaminase/5-amino-6-(5-phosphoribosylamino)uracil reductase RibD [Fimbriimonas sp.]
MNDSLMRRAIRLSRKGFPAPNPHVGCVIVKDGEIVGEGYHDHAGGPHAEIVALRQAGEAAKGADVYVTLEPCNHVGRTGPCSLALIQAEVSRVFVACPDPNPRAQGGADTLRSTGIPVEVGLLEQQAAAENLPFLTAMRLSRPYVVVKSAAGLDGRSALPSGESKWITGEAARRQGRRLRAECGAVLVGYRTVLADDPQLTARIRGAVNQPLRVVLDPHARLSGSENVFDDGARTKRITGMIDLPRILEDLFNEGVTGLLVEGGARTIGHFFQEKLVDRLELFMAPKLLGEGPSWLEGLRIETLGEAPACKIQRVRRIGHDIQVTAAVC